MHYRLLIGQFGNRVSSVQLRRCVRALTNAKYELFTFCLHYVPVLACVLQSVPAVVGVRASDTCSLSAVQTSNDGGRRASIHRRLQHVHPPSLHRRSVFYIRPRLHLK